MMTRLQRTITAWVLIGLVSCSMLSTGCPIRDNVSINYILPLGFGGSPGLFNPFGIVQALVNAWLGTTLGTSSGGDTTTTGGGSPSPTPIGAIGGAVNQF